MVRGIETFKQFFKGFEDNYVIIGGTACEIHEDLYAQVPRATKDIDIILIVEALSAEFVAKFWEFVKNYLGEAYFFRALVYFRIMALYGDIPVITEVLPDEDNVIVENSKRTPRNEVARFILSDLDKAIEMCYTRSKFNGQRVNREAAQLIKSRIALFEGTFEKYHRGSGRVPGDANWPGAKMSYNQGKTFNQEAEVKFFLTEAMNAAKEVADNADLAENNHKIDPVYGDKDDWNPYFNLFSQFLPSFDSA